MRKFSIPRDIHRNVTGTEIQVKSTIQRQQLVMAKCKVIKQRNSLQYCKILQGTRRRVTAS